MTRHALFLALPLSLAACFVESQPPQQTTPQPSEVRTRDHRESPGDEPTPPPSGGGGLESASPFECHGNESVVLENCLIEGGDKAIDAHGNCSVVLTNCEIRASGTAIDAHGNASVVIRGGSIDAPVAVDAHGNSSVVIESAAVAGAVDRHGNASVVVN
jgi:hypothetical protein